MKNYLRSSCSLVPALRHGPASLVSALMCAALIVAVWAAPSESYGATGEQYYRGFTYEVINNEVCIRDYAGRSDVRSEDVVTVPGKINGRPVVEFEIIDVVGKSISFKECGNLRSIYAEGVYFGKVVLPKSAKLTSVIFRESGAVTSLNFNSCRKLEHLYLGIESLTKLTLSACTKLQDFYMTYNDVRSLNLSKCAALREIVIGGTDLMSLNLGKKRSLKVLDVSDNKLRRLSVSGCPALEQLDFSYNEKLSVNISKNRKLKTLTYTPRAAGGKAKIITNPFKAFPKVLRYTNM